MQPQPHDPSTDRGAAAQPLPMPLRVLIGAMGIFAPGGMLFLLALAFSENVHLKEEIWFVLAALGGVGAYFLQRRLALLPAS